MKGHPSASQGNFTFVFIKSCACIPKNLQLVHQPSHTFLNNIRCIHCSVVSIRKHPPITHSVYSQTILYNIIYLLHCSEVLVKEHLQVLGCVYSYLIKSLTKLCMDLSKTPASLTAFLYQSRVDQPILAKLSIT